MKNKAITLLLVLTMMTTLFAGCGKSKTTSEGNESADNAQVTQAVSEASTEASHIIVTYLTMGSTPKDLTKVQDAVNEITKSKINVEVEFRPIAISEAATNYSLWISSGEQIDLMMLAFQNVASYTSTGSLEPLGDLLDKDGADISKLAKDYPLYEGATINGEIYGVSPVAPCYGSQGAVILRSDVVKDAGIEVKDKYTMDDMTKVFAAIKKVKPDMYPYGILGSSVGAGTSYSNYEIVDTLGSSVDSGALIGTDSSKVVNVFETDGYYNFLKKVQEWYKAGYIMPDAATTDSTMPELMQNSVIAGVANNYTPVIYADFNSAMASMGGATVYPLTDMFYPSNSASNGTYWTIPITSKDPDAAMKFLNLTYADSSLMNLIQWGIEGEHYVKSDKENIIKFADGVDPNTSGYYNTLGLWGDRRAQYFWSEASTREGNDAYTQKAMANPSKASGYTYDNSNMTNQIVAVDSVLKQYLPSLETGSVDNLDSVYKEFIAALKTAGIDDIIADNQTQFDAWIAGK